VTHDPDDHHVHADRARSLLGMVEARTGVPLEVGEHAVGEQSRGDVDLDVELPELGLEVRVGDRFEHGGVGHRRLAGTVSHVRFA
jgi:hypothetical protein